MQELLQQLGVKEYYPGKLTISKVLEIGADSLRDHTSTESCQIMWNFIRKVIMVHSTARKAAYVPEKSENTMEERNETNECDTLDVDELFQDAAVSSDTSIHPLDLIVLTILCSDQFLQQELMCKMAMCQFALPLLMPNGFGNTTFLLWALRSIVKKWSLSSQVMSKVFAEDNMVNVSIPTVAFVRLGACNVSKSKMLNEFLSDGQLNNFVNCSMEQGDVERKISKGLAEICWYLPSGNATLDFFTDAFAVINLRGDAKNHRNQFNFLNEVSSAIFIFVGNLGKEENDILKSLSHSKSKLFLILTPCAQDLAETKSQLKDLILCLNLTKNQFLKFGISAKDFITHLRERVKGILPSTRNDQKKLSLEEMADVARRHSFLVDEDTENCKKGKENVKEILSLIETEDVAQFRRENLHFQGDHWKQWSKIDKEQNRLKKRGTQPSGQYISDLELKKNKLREQQLGNKVSKFMVKFITEIHSKDQSRLFFLQWLKIQLDSRSRKNLRILHNRYKELCEQSGVQNEKLKDLDKIISESSLGIEHLLREMGQIYEAVESHSLEPQKNEYQQLPHCAAQLMLNGIPLELMDGDASNIPIHWITNVLDELGNIVDKGSRMFVITVLGVQSTGKSTLLNTMFGLQFAVSSGRCTRGAFIQLLKVKGDYTHKLGCDYIMVIDTEGLKAPELSQQDDSYEHDNELATLVIGLSDLTLINMAMENYCEMKDVLQIAVHAFIRMREVGRKPHCQFIHQNVGDVTAHERNIRDCRHFFDQLNEMTKSAARMENREEQYATFADVMEYNPSKNNWYIASLWHGNPPMAAVNTGYCENILDLKRYIFDCLEQRQSAWKAFTIQDFSKWMKDVWKAVKKENFIFSFRNSLVAEAYNGLSLSYCEWEWELRKDLLSWTQQSENKIGNALQSAKLETYFSSGMDNVHLIERYKAEFQLGLDILAKELKNSAIDKCLDTISRQKGLLELNSVQKGYQQEVENQVNILLSICKQKKKELQEDELELEFEDMWRQVTSKLPHSSAGKKDIVLDMENALRDTMQAHTVSIQTSLIKEDHLDEFSVKQDHIDLKTIKAKTPLFIKKHIQGWEMSCAEQTKELFIHNIIQFLDEKEKGGMNYDQNYCRETLRTIDELVRNHSSDTFKLNENFKADFKLYISGFAVSRFQKMQDRFYKENDPMEKLEQQKQRYLEIFKDTYCRRDQTQKKADMFCEDCLKPAILQRIETHLGASVLEDVRCNRTSLALSTSKFFQAALLLHLMQEDQFQEYYRYINHYEDYASDWIKDRVIKHCTTLNPDGNSRFVELAIHILKQITHAAKEAIKDASTCTISTLIGDLLEAFVKKMEKELVIPTDKLDIVVFQNDGNIKHFAEAVLVSIDELEKALEEEIGKWEVTKVLFNLPTKPAEELINSLLNCKKQCPFCGVPCERAGPKHSEHFSEYHIPDGLCGYANTATEKLSTEICTTSVTSGEMFINEDTDYNYVLYRRYKSVNEYYNSWQIQADSSYSASSYWKWIFYRFNHQFAEKYKRDPADVPEGWNISEQQVKKDLEDTYKVNLDSLI
ncbi:GVIN1 GTPase, partial [Amia calva]|nr:GVIN1 GTPase [Amia calva]